MAELERQRVLQSRSSPGNLAPAPAYCKETASDDAGGLHRSPPGGSRRRLGPGVPGEIGQERQKAGKKNYAILFDYSGLVRIPSWLHLSSDPEVEGRKPSDDHDLQSSTKWAGTGWGRDPVT
ncbi:hypothetical protein ACRRTK_011374 [Alexandromys fortis]